MPVLLANADPNEYTVFNTVVLVEEFWLLRHQSRCFGAAA